MNRNESLSNWSVSTNEEIRDEINKLYNGWFARWRDRAATASDTEWGICIAEADAILKNSKGTIASQLAMALAYELEARWQAANANKRNS